MPRVGAFIIGRGLLAGCHAIEGKGGKPVAFRLRAQSGWLMSLPVPVLTALSLSECNAGVRQ